MLYDGSPFERGGKILFDYAEQERFTHFGTSAKFIDSMEKRGLAPIETHKFPELRMILSTGSPLVAESYDYVLKVKDDVCLASISGGTDIMAAFADANPVLAVYRGEIQCRSLGMAVDVFNEAGESIVGEKGELVCTKPVPSMPLGFWNDRGGEKYRAAYYDKFPNVWTHGDWCELTERGTMIVYGRSDATLNPGGVRIGTAEIYRQVEKIDEVEESVAIGQLWPPDKPTDTRVVLFVRLRPGFTLNESLIERIKMRIRDNTTPRHVPARIVQVPDIPRTKNGKVVELAVKSVVHGMPVGNTDALANPEALDLFRNIPRWRPRPSYSLALIPACLITLAHCGISRSMTAASSAGAPPMTSRPRSLSFLRTSGAARILAVSRCSLSMIAGAVPAGAMSPNHGTASNPG